MDGDVLKTRILTTGEGKEVTILVPETEEEAAQLRQDPETAIRQSFGDDAADEEGDPDV